MKSLGSTMNRRGFAYVMALVVIVAFAGAAGMYSLEKGNEGFENYGMALWWTAMRITTAGSDFWPQTPEGRGLAFILTVFGYVIFGYVTATLASYFVGRDAEEKDAPIASTSDVAALQKEISELTKSINEMKSKLRET
jgi:voltage-gated potassium channel